MVLPLFIFIIIAFVVGTFIGSFLNVATLRYGTDKPTVGGRSKCVECERTLVWYELVPVVSFVVLRGRCRTCNTKLNFQYPVVELLTGILFAITVFAFGLSWQTLLAAVLIALLIAIAVYDLRTLIIPNPWVYSFDILALLALLFNLSFFAPTFALPTWIALLSGPIIASPFVFLWLISSGRWMGLGDAKLALGIGWLLFPIAGLIGGFSALIFAFWLGAVVGILLVLFSYLKNKNKSRENEITFGSAIPFGPFLIIGFLVVYFFGFSIIDLFL